MSWIKLSGENLKQLESARRDSDRSDSKLEGKLTKNPQEGPADEIKMVREMLLSGLRVIKSSAPVARGRRSKKAGASGSLPPEIPTWQVQSVTLRFRTSAAITTATGIVSVEDVFGAIGVVGRVTNTSVTALASSFRLREVRIYPGGSSTAQVDASVSWFAANLDQEPDMEKNRGAPVNYTAQPPVVVSRPPKNSTAGFWFRNVMSPVNTACMILAISTTGAIVDVDLDFTLPTALVTSQIITVGTAVVGTFYRLSLNRVVTANTLVPLDYTTTI